MFINNYRFWLCLTGTVLVMTGVIFLPRYISRSLDLRDLNQVEMSGREDFSFLEQGSNDVVSAFAAFQNLNHYGENPLLLASIEEPIQINSELIEGVYSEAVAASEMGMIPWIGDLYTAVSAAESHFIDDASAITDEQEAVWINWSDYIQFAKYYSLTCESKENPNKKELLNFWYVRFSDGRQFDYSFVVNAVNYQIYYAELHNAVTQDLVRQAEEYQDVYGWDETDTFFTSYGDVFVQGCADYYRSSGYDVINRQNLYQKLNLAILYFENEEPVYLERSVAYSEDPAIYDGIRIGFQDLIRWVRLLPESQ